MDHANAVATQALERYLLGELIDVDADQFEEHFFDCAECAEDVRAGMRMMEGGREIASEQQLAPVVSIAERRQRRIGWMQIAAASVLVVGLAVPQFVRERDDSWSGPMRVMSASRGPDTNSWKAGKRIVAMIDIQSDPQFVRYDLEILDANGKHVRDIDPIPSSITNDTVGFSTSELPAGTYTLSIIGVRGDGNRSVSDTREFRVVP